MKIWNIKINLQKIIITTLLIILVTFFIYLFLNNQTVHMNNENYTTILRDFHNNISKYVGKKIITSGYVFRGKDFNETQFVVARDMLVSDNEANIVGFLCEYPQIADFENNVWVEVEGTIILGNYYGPMPIIKVNSIKRITTPNDVFVYPPEYAN